MNAMDPARRWRIPFIVIVWARSRSSDSCVGSKLTPSRVSIREVRTAWRYHVLMTQHWHKAVWSTFADERIGGKALFLRYIVYTDIGLSPRPTIETARHRLWSHAQIAAQRTQSTAQTFLDHGVVKRIGQHAFDGIRALDAPSQQMR